MAVFFGGDCIIVDDEGAIEDGVYVSMWEEKGLYSEEECEGAGSAESNCIQLAEP